MPLYFLNCGMRTFSEEERHIAYFPERSVIMQVNSAGLNILERMQTRGIEADMDTLQFLDTMTDLELVSDQRKYEPSPDNNPEIITEGYNFRTLTLFLTEECNLRCRYCYAEGGTGGRTMNYETAETALRFMADHCRKNGFDFHVAYHGSGEPTAAGELLEKTVLLAEKLAQQNSLNLYFSIGTNGVMDDRYRSLLIEKDFDISLSLDGFEKTHNFHRPMLSGNSHKEAMKTAYMCTDMGHPFSVRTTVTKDNMAELNDFVSFIFESTSCELIQLEPVYMAGRAASGTVSPPDENEFTETYFRSMETAEALDRNVCYSGISYPAQRDFFCQACGMSLCVRPDGTLTGCYESAGTVPEKDPFHLGEISEGEVIIDKRRCREVSELSLQKEKCRDCMAFEHCAGECPSKMTASSGQDGYRCRINRKILEKHLLLCLEESGEGCIKFN